MMLCDISDIKSIRRFFTWNNKQTGRRTVFSKNDGVMGNQLWEDSFPNSEVTFLSEGDFDHSPMVIHFFTNSTGK